MSADRHDARLRELLVQRALEGIDAHETAELRSRGVDPAAPDAFELAAAAAHLALLDAPREPLPPALRRRIEATARDSLGRPPDLESPRS